jgi:hypothetical protein
VESGGGGWDGVGTHLYTYALHLDTTALPNYFTLSKK